jgi:hypothetical protein
MVIIQAFIYLQALDLITTLIGFRLGASEASPFIRVLMHVGPVAGVALSKALALGFGALCVYWKRQRLIRLATYWYSALVLWNLLVILAAPGHRAF